MKMRKRNVRTSVLGWVLVAVCALSAVAPAMANEGSEDICREAFQNCLHDLSGGLLGWWNVLLGAAYCLNGREFCRKYVQVYL
jgi:hypothetical protein